ncbi:GDSL-like lipase/acylhydrolase family protein [Actinomycetospora succinea]|uniref:GDSL-like lipase/acylhydrolase family protein n=1 Tax=Actinomycetospora succinea TaxID=663603 RepID=A0A4R6V5A9_9PSEU|nr:diglucosylglycerate octanoyltransferase [Actinomycetospora succinea]TDQ54038.1 GDSL-like lipase/acylhydrolase family protein [Actinomycetospora succinea]
MTLLVVIGDSLSFHGPDRAEPADEPRLWPHVAASTLGGRAELHAGLGWTARHAWRAMVGDPRIWASLRHADAVVLGIGGMDTLPSPVPTALRELIPAVHSPRVRRAARDAHAWVVPRAARALGRAGPVALPPAETVRHLELLRVAVTALIPGLPVVGMLPSVHRAPFYGGVHAGRDRHVAAMTAWAHRHGVRLVDPVPLVADHVLGGHGNPDGIHWGWTAHAAVGAAVGTEVAAALADRPAR